MPIGVYEANLGTPRCRGSFQITDAKITPGSHVLAWQAPGPYTGKGSRADEAEMQPVSVICVESGSGVATVRWQTPPMIVASPIHKQGRLEPIGATYDRLDNQRRFNVAMKRIGRVGGSVKFAYQILI